MLKINSFFSSPAAVFFSAFLFRAILLVYGHFQDQHSALKYTDIDYFVFTDAARYVAWDRSPYLRDTYRYTPLLAWMLVPTTWGGWWFDFGKALFAASDIVAGWLIYIVLRSNNGMPVNLALKYASLWLLNPMVAQISTRGSSEGLLAVMVIALLWAALQRRYTLAGIFLGLAVHFKIYPFIYAASIFWWLDDKHINNAIRAGESSGKSSLMTLQTFLNPARITLTAASIITFFSLNFAMFWIYGVPFLEHTYFYHVIRSDHRHNFSPYNVLLYLNSSSTEQSGFHLETLAFIPQLFLSAFAIPVVLAKYDLPSCMLAQTFAFVTFNKVCTSQYFLWYMVFLPFYFRSSSLLQRPRLGMRALALWVLGQAIWLQQGYQLEFMGQSTFIPGLWTASLGFFAINAWILGIVVSDVRRNGEVADGKKLA